MVEVLDRLIWHGVRLTAMLKAGSRKPQIGKALHHHAVMTACRVFVAAGALVNIKAGVYR